MRQGVEAILHLAGVDDVAVELGIGIDVVVVIVQACVFQRMRLFAGEHAERRAGFQAERLDLADHRRDLGHIAILRRAPGRAHAEARRTGGLRLPGLRHHVLGGHELRGIDAGVVARRLRAVAAILRATAGLHRQQGADLYFGGIEVLPVRAAGAMQQFGERQVEQGFDLAARPVVADGEFTDVGHGSFPTDTAR